MFLHPRACCNCLPENLALARFFCLYVFPHFTILRHTVTVNHSNFTYTVSRACANMYPTDHLYYSWQVCALFLRFVGYIFSCSQLLACIYINNLYCNLAQLLHFTLVGCSPTMFHILLVIIHTVIMTQHSNFLC